MWPYYVVQSTQSRAWNVLCYSVLYWVPAQLQYISPVLCELWYIFSVNISSDERVVSACFSRGRVHKLSHMIVPMVSRFIGIRRYMPLCLLHWKTEHPWKSYRMWTNEANEKKTQHFVDWCLFHWHRTQSVCGWCERHQHNWNCIEWICMLLLQCRQTLFALHIIIVVVIIIIAKV